MRERERERGLGFRVFLRRGVWSLFPLFKLCRACPSRYGEWRQRAGHDSHEDPLILVRRAKRRPDFFSVEVFLIYCCARAGLRPAPLQTLFRFHCADTAILSLATKELRAGRVAAGRCWIGLSEDSDRRSAALGYEPIAVTCRDLHIACPPSCGGPIVC